MTVARKLNVRLGLERLAKPRWPSEPRYVAMMNAQVRALTADLDYIFQQFKDVTPELIKEAMQPIFDRSQYYCPVDTQALKNSGYLEITEFRGRPRVEIGYARGGFPRYAPYVHEMTHLSHKAPTRAKFLQAAVDEELFGTIDRIAAGYKRFMGV